MHGSSIRTCQSNGTWDGFETFCEGKTAFQVVSFKTWSIGYDELFVYLMDICRNTICCQNVFNKAYFAAITYKLLDG